MSDSSLCPECLAPKRPPRILPLRRGEAPGFDLLCGECAKNRLNSHTFGEAASLARGTLNAMPEEMRAAYEGVFEKARLAALEGRSLASSLTPPRRFDFARCFTLSLIRAAEAVAHATSGNTIAAQSSLCASWTQLGVARGLMLASASIDKPVRDRMVHALGRLMDPRRAKRAMAAGTPIDFVGHVTEALEVSLGKKKSPKALQDLIIKTAKEFDAEGKLRHGWKEVIRKRVGCSAKHVGRVFECAVEQILIRRGRQLIAAGCPTTSVAAAIAEESGWSLSVVERALRKKS